MSIAVIVRDPWIRPGWVRLITEAVAAAQTADSTVDGVAYGVKGGRLHLEPASGAANERARGILAAARALSGEICERCGGPGGPVELASGSRGARCGGCRTASDQVLPRPAWRRDRDLEREAVDTAARESHRQYATLEDLLGEDLAALMEARVRATQRRWPLTPVGSAQGLAPWGLDYTGWLHLLRAALTLLLPDECDGQAQPIRITQIKQRLGVLVIHHVGRTALRRGVCELVERISGHTCMKCGHPGRPRGGRCEPLCETCWKPPIRPDRGSEVL